MAVAGEWTHGAKPVDLRTDQAHAARVYDVLLGGKTNYRADREAARQVIENMPDARRTALENRAFMTRAARYLAAEAGIRQFLDIGTGIPAPPNLHETVQQADPRSRVVYVDNDPIVLVHSRALHESGVQGRTTYIDADLCEPERILGHPELRDTLDPAEPVAITLLTVLHWLPAGADPYAIVRTLMEAVPSGSYLAVSHVTADLDPVSVGGAVSSLNARGSNVTPRTEKEVRAFFDGLELVDPGLTPVQRWRPGLAAVGPAHSGSGVPLYVGVGRKP